MCRAESTHPPSQTLLPTSSTYRIPATEISFERPNLPGLLAQIEQIISKLNANHTPDLTHKLDTLPDRPGVYIYRSPDRKVIYVGKAVVLRNRVRSYFHANRDPKTRRLVARSPTWSGSSPTPSWKR